MAQLCILMYSKCFFTSYHALWVEIGFVLPLQPNPLPLLQVHRAGGGRAASTPSVGVSALLQAPLTHGGGAIQL